jgi:hypothetical protein
VAERNVGQESAADTLAAIAAGTVGRMLLPLVPLMQGAGEPGIIEEWVRLASAEPDPWRLSLYGLLARTFAARSDHPDPWLAALKEWNVTRSPVFEEIRELGRGEVRAEAQVMAVLAVLEARFQTFPADLAAAIRSITDLGKLSALIPLAAKAPSLDQFRADAGV